AASGGKEGWRRDWLARSAAWARRLGCLASRHPSQLVLGSAIHVRSLRAGPRVAAPHSNVLPVFARGAPIARYLDGRSGTARSPVLGLVPCLANPSLQGHIHRSAYLLYSLYPS